MHLVSKGKKDAALGRRPRKLDVGVEDVGDGGG